MHVETKGAAEGVAERLERRLRLRVLVVACAPGSLPRTETGKAKRLFERVDETDPW